MLKPHINVRLIVSLLAAASNAAVGGDAEHGQSLYQNKCTACHSVEYNGVGPAHKGVYGRKAGSAPDFMYSEALKRSAVIWDENTLNKWLTDPEKFIPGQKMGFLVPNAKERADLIAYLKQTESK